MFSAGSASISHRTSIECIFIEPTDDCSVPGLHRGASEIQNFFLHIAKEYKNTYAAEHSHLHCTRSVIVEL